jgi:PAS domain S-box-containing protein
MGAVTELDEFALLRGMVDNSPVGQGVLDHDLRFRRINDTLAALNGVPAKDHLGRTPMDLLPGVPPETYVHLFRDVLDGRAPLHRTHLSGETPAQPGVRRQWEETFYPILDDGEIVGVGIIALEVTERRAAEQALRHSEATLRLILDSAPNGLLLVDAEGRIQAANPECARLFGYGGDELVGQPVEVLIPGPLQEGHRHFRGDYARDARTRLMAHGRDLRGRRKDGSEFPVEVGLAVAENAPGLVTAVVTDVSERKRIEAERAALLEAERASAERLAQLQHVTEAGLAPLPFPELVREVLERVRDSLDADGAAILLLDEARARIRVAAQVGLDGFLDDGEGVPVGQGVAGRVARDGVPRRIDDVSRTPEAQPLLVNGPRNLIATPLVVQGSVIGVLEVASYAPARFTDSDLTFLGPLSARVALAVDRARAFERERHIAETLQRSLLPERLPDVERATLAARYLPGAAGTRVGGDWYDVLPRPAEDDVLLVIGDVMGNGVRAASVMGQLRAALRIYVDMGLDLTEVMGRLNTTVLGMGESEMATLLMVRLCPRTGELDRVSAGHLPAVVRGPDGAARLLEDAPGIALGATADADYKVATEMLEPGSTLLLYTDGLVERPGASLREGFDELRSAVSGAAPGPDALCDELVARFLPVGGVRDDVALLAVELLAVPVAPLSLELPGSSEALVAARASLRAWLARAGADDEEALDVLLAVNEALARASAHQGAGRPERLTVELRGDRVVVALDAVSAPPPEGTDRGRGLVLMESVVNELSISREGTGRPEELRLVRRLANPAR